MNPSTNQPATAPVEEELKLPPPTAEDLQMEKPERVTSSLLDKIVSDMDTADRGRLARVELEALEFFHNQRKAKMYAASRYFTDVANVAQAATKIEIGKSWRMSEGDAMRFIFFVNGRPSVMEEYLLGRIQERGWSFVSHYVGGRSGKTCKGVYLFVYFKGEKFMVPKISDTGKIVVDDNGNDVMEQLSVSFLEEDAMGITISEKGQRICLLNKKGPWADGYRSAMYFWRTISRFRREHAADILTGALTPEEAESLDVAELEVSTRETPFPSQRAPITEKIDAVLTKRATRRAKDADTVGGETKPADPETKTPEPETKAADSETKSHAGETKPAEEKRQPIMPVTADQIKALRKFDGHLGSDLFYAILADFDLKTPEMINSFELAGRVIGRMQGEWDKAKAKPV